MSISTIPNEALLLIGQKLQSQADLHPLVHTCRRFYSLLKHLLYRHNLKYHDGDGIIQAAKLGSIPAVAQFIEEGYPVEDRPVHQEEHRRLRRLATPSPCSCNMEHPILSAARYGHAELVRYLLNAGAGSSFANHLGKTPLHLAARNGFLPVIEVLLNEGGAEVSMFDDKFTLAPIKEAAVGGHIQVVEYLLPNTPHNHDYASELLPFAAASGERKLVSKLLDLGAQVNYKYEERYAPRTALKAEGQGFESTALSVAVRQKDIYMVNHLLAHGADVNLATGFSEPRETPLHIAIGKHYNEICKTLLAHGASIDNENLLDAVMGRNKIILAMLLAKHKMGECPMHLLEVAAGIGDKGILQLLLDERFDKEAALLAAISRNKEKLVARLLAHGANVDLPSLPKSAVGVAIVNRNVGIIRTLLRHGAHAFPEDLEAARAFSHEDIVKLAEGFPVYSHSKRYMYPEPFLARIARQESQEGWRSVDQDWGSTRRRLRW